MKIGVAGPIDLNLLRDLFAPNVAIPNTYSFPLVATLARELHNRAHHITVFTLSGEVTRTQRIDGNQITLYICPARRPRFQMLDFFRAERHVLRNAMRQSGCDVIHAHWTYEFAAAAIETGMPHVITAHDVPTVVLRFARNAYWFEKPWLALPVLRKARCVTAVSPYLAEELERFLRPQKDVVVVPNGVGPEVFQLGDRRTRKAAQVITFLSVLNGWGPRKNAKALIQAFALVRREFSDRARLKMLGHGFEKGGSAERWATVHQIHAGVEFVGPLKHSDVLRTLADDVDVLVHPALEETFCMVALEAMAVGVPVIGGKESGAIPWLLDKGTYGGLTDVTSPKDLGQAMASMFHTRGIATERARRARTLVREKFSITGVVDKYERLCEAQIR